MVDRLEVPTGLINGANTLFTLSRAYTAGSLFITVNGLKRVPADDDGLVETSPIAGTFTTKLVLPTGTTLEAEYLDTAKDVVLGTQIHCRVRDVHIRAQVRTP